MRKTLITTTLVLGNLLFNKHVLVQAQIKIYPECYAFGILLERIDDKNIVCFDDSENNSKSSPNVKYCLKKWTQENNQESVCVFVYKNNTRLVIILGENGGIAFNLKGRHFDSWAGKPNTVILEKHRQDVTQILNIIEKYSIDPATKDF